MELFQLEVLEALPPLCECVLHAGCMGEDLAQFGWMD